MALSCHILRVIEGVLQTVHLLTTAEQKALCLLLLRDGGLN